MEGFFLLCSPHYYCLDLFEIIIFDSRRFEGRVVWDGHSISLLILVVGINLHFLIENILKYAS